MEGAREAAPVPYPAAYPCRHAWARSATERVWYGRPSRAPSMPFDQFIGSAFLQPISSSAQHFSTDQFIGLSVA